MIMIIINEVLDIGPPVCVWVVYHIYYLSEISGSTFLFAVICKFGLLHVAVSDTEKVLII